MVDNGARLAPVEGPAMHSAAGCRRIPLRIGNPFEEEPGTHQAEAGQLLLDRWAPPAAPWLALAFYLLAPQPGAAGRHCSSCEAGTRRTPTLLPAACRARHWDVLEWLLLLNARSEIAYRDAFGDKDTYRAAFMLAGKGGEYQQARPRGGRPGPGRRLLLPGQSWLMEPCCGVLLCFSMLQVALAVGFLLYKTAPAHTTVQVEHWPAWVMYRQQEAGTPDVLKAKVKASCRADRRASSWRAALHGMGMAAPTPALCRQFSGIPSCLCPWQEHVGGRVCSEGWA